MKNTKIVIWVLWQNSDVERCSQKAHKLANIELLSLQNLKSLFPSRADSVGVSYQIVPQNDQIGIFSD